jgi:hypothetical protein
LRVSVRSTYTAIVTIIFTVGTYLEESSDENAFAIMSDSHFLRLGTKIFALIGV